MTADQKHNAICNITGEGLWGFQAALVPSGTVLTVLLLRMGARTSTIGLIPTLEGATLLLQVVGIYLFRHHKTRKVRIVLWHYLAMIPFLGLMGIAILCRSYFSAAGLIVVLLGSWAMFFAAVGVVGAAWLDWIAHLFDEKIRGTITGMSWGFSSLAGVAATLLAGWVLRHHPLTDTYGYLYLAASTFASLSIATFLLIRDPAENLEDHTPPRFTQMLHAAMSSLKNANVRAILIGRCLSLAGFCIGPFIAVHFRSVAGGGLSDSLIVTLGSAQTLGAAISCIAFGRIGDRLGHRFGFLMGTLLQVACLSCILMIPGVAGCLLAFLFAGGVGGVLTISYMNLIIESCPHEIRSAHLVVGNVIVGVAAMLFPVLGSHFAQAHGLRDLMLASLVISCIAAGWIALRVRNPRHLRLATERSSISS
jgi:MFS family permease